MVNGCKSARGVGAILGLAYQFCHIEGRIEIALLEERALVIKDEGVALGVGIEHAQFEPFTRNRPQLMDSGTQKIRLAAGGSTHHRYKERPHL